MPWADEVDMGASFETTLNPVTPEIIEWFSGQGDSQAEKQQL